jgi:hypothetical protein
MELDLKEFGREYKLVKMNRFFEKLKKCNADFYVRLGSECNELIYDGKHKVYATENKNFPRKFIYLFNVVQIDVKKYVAMNPFIEVSPMVKVSEYNYNYDDSYGTITGTDLDHAFWRIAYVKGYISKKTYNAGLNDEAKALRLATLSVLGREKRFQKYENGVLVGEVITKPLNPELQQIYKDIRYSCYYMMYELSLLLGDDFDCWRTDCIYYRDTPENRKIVHDYFDARDMLYKQLVYSSLDSFTPKQ